MYDIAHQDFFSTDATPLVSPVLLVILVQLKCHVTHPLVMSIVSISHNSGGYEEVGAWKLLVLLYQFSPVSCVLGDAECHYLVSIYIDI